MEFGVSIQVTLHKELNAAAKIAALYECCGEAIELSTTERYFLGLCKREVQLGWLWIKRYEGCWRVFSANGRTSHFAATGPVVAADFHPGTGERVVGPMHLTGAWKSARTMWPVTRQDEAALIFGLVSGLVDLAYEQYIGSTVPAILLSA